MSKSCSTCDLRVPYSHCEKELSKWLLEEYKEPPSITSNEKKLLEMINPNYKYIARDKDTSLYIYTSMPSKEKVLWASSGQTKGFNFFNGKINFHFIKWEDENAWRIEDLLKLEVKDNG